MNDTSAEAPSHRNHLILLAAIGITPFLVNGYINSLIFENALLYWSFEFFSWIALPVLIFSYAVKKCELNLVDFEFHTRIFGKKSIGLLILTCIIFAPIDFLVYRESISYFASEFPGKEFFSYNAIIPKTGVLKIVIPIYFALSAGIVEELYYRGLLLKISRSFSSPKLLFLIISPIIFALIHWEGGLAKIFATYVTGFFYAIAFMGFKNIWPLIVGHVFTDYIYFS